MQMVARGVTHGHSFCALGFLTERGKLGMSTVLKSLVERIITDAGFRTAFIMKPQQILKSQVISRAERRALLRARRRLILAGSGSEVALTPFEWP